MSSQGPYYCGTAASASASGSTGAWSTPTACEGTSWSSNTGQATTQTNTGYSDYLQCTNFNQGGSFSIPTGATINGVYVEINGEAHHAGATFYTVQLIVSGSASGSNLAASTSWTTAAAVYGFGGSTNLWGCSLTPSICNASNFGVVIQGNSIASVGYEYVLGVRITVYYTAGSSGSAEIQSGFFFKRSPEDSCSQQLPPLRTSPLGCRSTTRRSRSRPVLCLPKPSMRAACRCIR